MQSSRPALIVVAALGGCGRIGFDPMLSDATGAGDAAWPTLEGTWTWMGGPNLGEQGGSYGVRGVPSPTNQPGPRDNGASWFAGDGSMWLFGGYGLAESATSSGHLGDLWRFDSSSGLWTWVHGARTLEAAGIYGTVGVPDASNQPGARNDAAGWVDATGDLWLLGGSGADSSASLGNLNDLWRFSVATGEWTWIGGSATGSQRGNYGTLGVPDAANIPGARSSAAIWVASTGVWLYGGDGFDRTTNGRLGDLWRYDQDRWTWIGGADVVGQSPANGTLGVPSPTNAPGGRAAGCAWTRPDELWLFGGGATDGRRNDLWRYSISAGVWTWLAGSNAAEQPGSYAPRGVSDPSSTPGARISVFCWRDDRGNLWLFGGRGRDRTGTLGALSDLWVYIPTTGAWTWVAGDDVVDQVGRYGTLGVADALNRPGGRDVGGTWLRPDGSLWLFGGDLGFDSNGAVNQLSDMWRFGPSL